MGEVVAAVAVTALSSWGASYTIGYLALQGTWMALGVQATFGVAGTMLTSSLFGQSSKGSSDLGQVSQERKLTLRSTVESRKLVYGTCMVSGPLALKTTTGNKKEYLHLVVSLATRKVQSITGVNFDGTLATAARISGYNRVKVHTGSVRQEADSDLVNEIRGWTTAHRGRGVAYIYARLKYDATTWPNGVKNVQAVVQGHAVYDPRRPLVEIASTAAGDPAVITTTAAHGLAVDDEIFIMDHAGLEKFYVVDTVPTTTSLTLVDPVSGDPVALANASTGGSIAKLCWTNNAALCILDYLLWPDGLNCHLSEINADYWIAAANICDEHVLLGATATCTVDPVSDLVTLAEAVPWQSGLQVRLSTSGTLPGGTVANKAYAWVRESPTTGRLAATKEDALYGQGIDLTSAGSGTLTLSAALDCTIVPTDHQQSATFTADIGTDSLTLGSAFYLASGKAVRLSSTGSLPSYSYNETDGSTGLPVKRTEQLSAGVDYYWISTSSTAGKLALSAAAATAGNALDISAAGTGTHTITNVVATDTSASGVVTLADNVPRDDDSGDDAEQDEIEPQFGWDTGDGVQFTAGTPPTGLTLGVTYYWIRTSNCAGRLAATHADAIDGVALVLNTAGTKPAMARVSQPRYTVNGQLDLGNKPIENLEKMLSACGGQVPYVQGQYRLHVAGAVAPSFELTASDARGSIKVRPRPAKRDLFNAVRGTFIDPTQLWQASDLPPVQSEQYQEEDGGEQIWKDVELPFTSDNMRGQRLLKIYLETGRQGMTVEFPARLTAGQKSTMEITGCDVGALDVDLLGFAGKLFTCTSWKFGDDLGVDLVLQEYAAEAFDWSPAEAVHADYAPNTSLANPWNVAAPTGLALESGTAVLYIRGDGTAQSRLRLAWTAPADGFVLSGGLIEAQYKPSAASDWQRAASVPGDATETYILDVEDGVLYDARIRAVNGLGAASAWVAQTGHLVLGKTEPPSDVTGLSAQQNGSNATYQWDICTDKDYAGTTLRYLPYPVAVFDWEAAQKITTHTKGTLVTNSAVPPGDWVIGAKHTDTSGNDSVNVATVRLTMTNANALLLAAAQAPSWPGTLTNLVRHHTGVLVPKSQLAASDDRCMDEFCPDPYATCVYEAPENDLGSDESGVRLWATPLSRLGPGESGSSSLQVEMDYRTDDGEFEGYRPWSLGVVTARHIRSRIVLDTSAGVSVLTEFTPTVDIEPRSETHELDVPAGGATITFDSPFHTPPVPSVTTQSASGFVAVPQKPTTTACEVKVYDLATGAAATETVSVSATFKGA